jgi:FlaA1/EpsC-like NDP-sugar epimerase
MLFIGENRHARAITLILIYSGVLLLCQLMAVFVRFDFSFTNEGANVLPATLDNFYWELPVKLVFLALFNQTGGIMRYFSLPDFVKLAVGLSTSSAIIYLMSLANPSANDPRSVMLLALIFSVGALTIVRLSIRYYWEQHLSCERQDKILRVVIIGAGDVGAQLAREMLTRRSMGMSPVAFLDDDRRKWKLSIHGIPVIGGVDVLTKSALHLDLDKAVLAMPNASPSRLGEIVNVLNHSGLQYETVPSLLQLASGHVSISRLRPVDIQDLLGRKAVDIRSTNAGQLVQDKVVAVTGAGGSIGSELCRQIASLNPRIVLLIDQSEPALFQIEQELIAMGYRACVISKVANILDKERMSSIFSRYHPTILFHAAAHKHVPMMEYQAGEAIKNNFFGTACIASLALEFNLQRLVLISTDKAINPTSVMGATKRMTEIYLQSLGAAHPGRTLFMAVRFGNVLGSSGSVIPIFKSQIAAGGPVTVTHPDVTRYFMTIPEAVGLVLQSAVIGEGNEIFMLDMEQPVKIVDLARLMIELSGFVPDEDIKIEYTGLRPGEKLFEELCTTSENHAATSHPKIVRYTGATVSFARVKEMMEGILPHVNSGDSAKLKELIREFVPEYQPFISQESSSRSLADREGTPDRPATTIPIGGMPSSA